MSNDKQIQNALSSFLADEAATPDRDVPARKELDEWQEWISRAGLALAEVNAASALSGPEATIPLVLMLTPTVHAKLFSAVAHVNEQAVADSDPAGETGDNLRCPVLLESLPPQPCWEGSRADAIPAGVDGAPLCPNCSTPLVANTQPALYRNLAAYAIDVIIDDLDVDEQSVRAQREEKLASDLLEQAVERATGRLLGRGTSVVPVSQVGAQTLERELRRAFPADAPVVTCRAHQTSYIIENAAAIVRWPVSRGRR